MPKPIVLPPPKWVWNRNTKMTLACSCPFWLASPRFLSWALSPWEGGKHQWPFVSSEGGVNYELPCLDGYCVIHDGSWASCSQRGKEHSVGFLKVKMCKCWLIPMAQPSEWANDYLGVLMVLCTLHELPWLPKSSDAKSESIVCLGESGSEIRLNTHYDLWGHERCTQQMWIWWIILSHQWVSSKALENAYANTTWGHFCILYSPSSLKQQKILSEVSA